MKWLDYIRRYKWDLAIINEADVRLYDCDKWDINVIKSPPDRWFADPFILDVTENHIYVLVEELSHRTNKGRIAKLTIDKLSYKLLDVKIILELPTHLSFPAIYRRGDAVFVYPENSASGKSIIYQYLFDDDILQPVTTMVDAPLTDAVMLDYNGASYLFATRIPEQNGTTLSVYKASSKMNAYQECQQIVFEDNTARNAGDFIYVGSRIIRPAQNCNGTYGAGLVFQELLLDQKGQFAFKELTRRFPPKGYIGMHTYNSYKGYAIIDLHARRFPVVHKVLQYLKSIMTR